MPLSVTDFGEYFHSIHGVDPFPWQTRLLDLVAKEGRWPSLLDLPTGTGKTAAIDIALFHLALEAENGEARRAPMRIILVVDRRTVVDQAYRRAREIRKRLVEVNGAGAEVRERLRSLAGDDSPLQIALLRGGIARDDAWARSPNQPLIALSTVDQIGSRLFFRGYGITESMRPIHAGLLGNDTLLLLDEVHLSRPFAQTLDAVASRYRGWAERRLPDRFQFVQMSATSGSEEAERFRLDLKDEKNDVLSARLNAPRPMTIREPVHVSGGEGRRLSAVADAAVEEATRLVAPGKAVAIVVNRVKCARQAFEKARAKFGAHADVRLLTGRMRPLDREQVEKEIVPRVEAGRKAAPDAKPILVVSTQCIEAGADFDFDALVTECASLDALRQRVGRLNRLGERDARGVILVRSDSVADEIEPDPVYGDALRATWRHLQSLGSEVDFGLTSFQVPEGDALAAMLAPASSAPTLLPAHLDFWVQTNPAPEPEPDIALWLHGPRRGAPDVQIIWRADVSSEEIELADPDSEALEALRDRLTGCPPAVAEALSVPFHEALAWLSGVGLDGPSDVEGADAAIDEREIAESTRTAIAWRGDDTCRIGANGDPAIRPGDTLVVPAEYGGISSAHRNWDPDFLEPVEDIAEEAVLRSRGRAVLRLDPVLLDGISATEIPGSTEDGPIDSSEITALFGTLAASTGLTSGQRESRRRLEQEFAGRRKPRLIAVARWDSIGEHRSFIISGRRIYPRHDEGVSDMTTDDRDEAGSFTGVAVELARHLKGVGDRARRYAERSGLPPEIVGDLALAGAWHDVGKADRRFQALLRGGSSFAVTVAKAPLAKSGLPQGDREARKRARELSGLPDGFRHELVSITLLKEATEQLQGQAHDWELVLHLVASHHGFCRPLAPAIEDREPVEVVLNGPNGPIRASSDHRLGALNSGVSRRFWRLVKRYGWHGLAWMEAILRLADHRQSECEQEEKDAT